MTPEEALETARALFDYCPATEMKDGTQEYADACAHCPLEFHRWCAIRYPGTWSLRYMDVNDE